jgi:hypothetical protein
VLLDREVRTGDRLSLIFPLGDGPDMRVTLEVRHVRPEEGRWRAGGLFRALPPVEHERVVRYIFAEMRRSLSE